MSLTGSILDLLPSYVPKSDIKVEESYEFVELSSSTPKTVYQIENGPVKRIDQAVAIVSGNVRELVVGDEVELRDTTGDGQLDSVALIDSAAHPDSGTEFTITYVAEPVISRYVGSFDDDLENLGDRIDASILSKYIETASGKELDLIGAAYGDVGRRLGRDDDEYRPFLRSIVQTFDATGTKSGIKFVTGAVLQVDPDRIEIIEDFEQTAFTVRSPYPTDSVTTSSLNELIRISSPTGVDVYEPPTLYIESEIGVTGKIPQSASTIASVGLDISTVPQSIPKGSVEVSTQGFGVDESSLGLGSSSLNSDRRLGSGLTRFREESQIGITSSTTPNVVDKPQIGVVSSTTDTVESDDGLSTGTLSSGDTFK